MIHRSLLLLSKLRLRGQGRQLKRTLSSPKGIVLAVITLGFFGMALVPFVLAQSMPKQAMPMVTWFLHPAALLAFWAFTVAGSSFRSPIAFSMAEVDFLFPGPFTRRQLLVYKLSATLLGTLGMAVMATLFLPWAWWPAIFVGIWLVGVFMQWSAVLTALAAAWLGTRFRRLLSVFALVSILAIAASTYQVGVFAPGLGIRERLAALESSWAAKVVLAPFVVFSRLIAARTATELVGWGTAALAMVAGVAAAILMLDVNFLDASLAASRRRYEALERLKRSGGLPSLTARSKPRFTVPTFPRMRGAGPIAWSQALQMLRGSGRLIILLPALVGPFAAMGILASRRANEPATGIVIGMTMTIAFLISTIVPLGMRTDLDHVDTIKSLPISAQAIVWGSLGTAIAYITLVQLIAVVAISVALGSWTWGASVAMALAAPVNLVLVGSDSILVLLFPAIRRFNPNDPLTGARMMLINLAKLIFVVLSAAVAAVAVLVAWLVFGDSLAAMAVAGCAAMTLEGLAMVWVAGLLFGRFDPSAHVAEGD